jgi:hypothetical protein
LWLLGMIASWSAKTRASIRAQLSLRAHRLHTGALLVRVRECAAESASFAAMRE